MIGYLVDLGDNGELRISPYQTWQLALHVANKNPFMIHDLFCCGFYVDAETKIAYMKKVDKKDFPDIVNFRIFHNTDLAALNVLFHKIEFVE